MALAALVVAALGAGFFYGTVWRAKMRVQPLQRDGARFAWLSRALEACEADAAKHPKTLYFMVVPLAPASEAAGGIRARALETVGSAILLESKTALDGLESGALRISREQFILHATDIGTNEVYRWKSASGVVTLSDHNVSSKGPFKIRLQTAPGDAVAWSSLVAEDLATCHWVFALLRG